MIPFLRYTFFILVLFRILSSPAAMASASPPAGRQQPVIAAYVTEWSSYDPSFRIDRIPVERLTHLIYAFAQIEDGEIALHDPQAALGHPPHDGLGNGNFAALQRLRERNPDLRILVAVGGWSLSAPFSKVAATQALREKFAASVVHFLQRYRFDGIDLDWEYPVSGGQSPDSASPADRANYTLLARTLRRHLDEARPGPVGKRYLLTIATPAARSQLQHFDLTGLCRSADWLNVMAYDYSGSWDKHTGHLAPLRGQPSVEDTLAAYTADGVRPRQIVLGIPLYARAWAGVADVDNGLGQPASGPAQGDTEPGLIHYANLVAAISRNPGAFSLVADPSTGATTYYNAQLEGGTFYSAETPSTVAAKVALVQDMGLRGVMLWSIDGDVSDPSDPDSLLGALRGLSR